MSDKNRGTVFNIQRYSVHDGPGIRTLVFLKGCPLRCQWCSTPESQSFGVEKTDEKVYGTLMTVEDVMKEIRKDSLFFFLSTGGVTLSGGEVLAQRAQLRRLRLYKLDRVAPVSYRHDVGRSGQLIARRPEFDFPGTAPGCRSSDQRYKHHQRQQHRA